MRAFTRNHKKETTKKKLIEPTAATLSFSALFHVRAPTLKTHTPHDQQFEFRKRCIANVVKLFWI